MKVTDFLSPSEVLIDVRGSQKLQLLKELARKIAPAVNLPADEISSALLKREELGSTGTGAGVAIPHARINGLAKPFGLFARMRQPIAFAAIDSQPVDLVFVVLMPITAQGEHLGALASVARRFRAPEAVARMRKASTVAELYRAVSE